MIGLGLTRQQSKLLAFITGRMSEINIGPSYDEMKEAIGIRSKSGIHRLIANLEDRGYVRRIPYRPRAIEVLNPPQVPNTVSENAQLKARLLASLSDYDEKHMFTIAAIRDWIRDAQ